MIEIVGVDADDTLWDEASHFDHAEQRFVSGVASWLPEIDARTKLRELHISLIAERGYGPHGYRTAMELFCTRHLSHTALTDGKALAETIFIELTKARLEPLPGVADALARLRKHFKLLLISKGDQARQRTKLDQSGLAPVFDEVIIVAEKDSQVYATAFGTCGEVPHSAMIGNSLKSDVLPAIAAGAYGVFVPHHRTSPLEEAEPPIGHPLFCTFPNIIQASEWLISQAYLR